jgi:aerobic-type carbon monoxide dehydrogenase small subunit (CoxS/CutS family)
MTAEPVPSSASAPSPTTTITVSVNGAPRTATIDSRMLLIHFIREELRLTGGHVGCVSGRCGCCTVLLNSQPVKACLVLAVQADRGTLTTIEGLSPGPDALHPIQQAFWDRDAAECGYCTPGMIMAAYGLLTNNPRACNEEIREAISGNLCRCTGYRNIVRAIEQARDDLAGQQGVV